MKQGKTISDMKIKCAVFTDLHYDHVPDANRRIGEIKENIADENVDFIVSLGDLCYPVQENKQVLDELEKVGKTVYYAVGNHDLDGYDLRQVVDFYNLRRDYYSFQYGGIKFIVLNSCYMKKDNAYLPYKKADFDERQDQYPCIPDFELQWLAHELQDEKLQYVIFTHHSLVNDFPGRGVVNRAEVRELLQQRKILLCMNGHDHGDDCKVVAGIPYFTLNSCSYIWHGTKKVCSYAPEVHAKYPHLEDMILYQTPLHCIVEIAEGKVTIGGMIGRYQTITPEEIGIGSTWNGVSIEAKVSDFKCNI